MITLRIARDADAWVTRMGREIGQQVGRWMEDEPRDATVVVGAGDPFGIRPDDSCPIILVPLVGGRRPSPLARAQMEQAHALVVVDPAEARWLPPGHRGTVVLVESDPNRGRPLLRGPGAFELIAAEEALALNPPLEAMLASRATPPIAHALSSRRVAEGVCEALAATGAPRSR